MRLIEQSYEFENESNLLRRLEKIGRTCYKSEDKITKDSALSFYRKMVKSGHSSVIEHINFAFVVDREKALRFNMMIDSQDLSFINQTRAGNRPAVFSGNLRAWRELYFKHSYSYILRCVIETIRTMEPVFVEDIRPYQECEILPAPKDLTTREKLHHVYKTVRIVTDRGVTHEIVRHRPVSYSQESTRYCNYIQDKFGNEITIVKPVWFESVEQEHPRYPQYVEWKSLMQNAETSYLSLITFGQTPQEARSVLPNSLKTELVMTCNLLEWKHFFKLRCSQAAHPQIRDLSKKMLQSFIKEHRVIFRDVIV